MLFKRTMLFTLSVIYSEISAEDNTEHKNRPGIRLFPSPIMIIFEIPSHRFTSGLNSLPLAAISSISAELLGSQGLPSNSLISRPLLIHSLGLLGLPGLPINSSPARPLSSMSTPVSKLEALSNVDSVQEGFLLGSKGGSQLSNLLLNGFSGSNSPTGILSGFKLAGSVLTSDLSIVPSFQLYKTSQGPNTKSLNDMENQLELPLRP